MYSLIISFLGSLLALICALWIERKKLPKLEIIASEYANTDATYTSPNIHAGERWKFFRVAVKNEPFIKPFRWIQRQTAENCHAKIEFYKIGENVLMFSMRGRWASTPELPSIPSDAILKLLHPDPVTIPINEQEFLDVIAKHKNDKEAYGWNNEAYFNSWRTPHYKLDTGKYLVKISIGTQNGVTFRQNFELVISDRIEDTSLRNIWEVRSLLETKT
jgi:hypothetical protein